MSPEKFGLGMKLVSHKGLQARQTSIGWRKMKGEKKGQQRNKETIIMGKKTKNVSFAIYRKIPYVLIPLF